MKQVILLTVLLWGATVQAAPNATNRKDVEAQISAATQLYETAKAGDHSWVATRRQIDGATKALAEGRLDDAATLAARAMQTAAASVAQMNREKAAWAARVPGAR